LQICRTVYVSVLHFKLWRTSSPFHPVICAGGPYSILDLQQVSSAQSTQHLPSESAAPYSDLPPTSLSCYVRHRTLHQLMASNIVIGYFPYLLGRIAVLRILPCGLLLPSSVVCRPVTEPCKNGWTEMAFRLRTRLGPRNHVVDGGPEVPRDVPMGNNFWISLRYSFGCIIASNTLSDSRGGFLGSSYPIKT